MVCCFTNLVTSYFPDLSCIFLQVLFTPATQAARQAACTIVEALTTIPSRKQQVLDLLTRYEPQTENQQVTLCNVRLCILLLPKVSKT